MSVSEVVSASRAITSRQRDIETGLPRQASPLPPRPTTMFAQRPVVDVEHPAPGDVVLVQVELVAWKRWLSIIAASRLCAAVTACMSPVSAG